MFARFTQFKGLEDLPSSMIAKQGKLGDFVFFVFRDPERDDPEAWFLNGKHQVGFLVVEVPGYPAESPPDSFPLAGHSESVPFWTFSDGKRFLRVQAKPGDLWVAVPLNVF
jgi:hypothetical protein